MVAVVVPLARFCGFGGCTAIGTKRVFDSQNRQWGEAYCATCAERVRDHINTTEQTELLQRLEVGQLLPGGTT